MQIFSELQRNSTDKIFIKLLIVYFVNFLSSFNPFFPLLIGIFILCESFFVGVMFIVFFSLFHNFNMLFFAFLFIFIKLILLERIKDIFDFHYQDAVGLFVVYTICAVYLFFFTDTQKIILFVYIIYNYAFDLVVIRLMKCELKSY
jgi:hypothetical protein